MGRRKVYIVDEGLDKLADQVKNYYINAMQEMPWGDDKEFKTAKDFLLNEAKEVGNIPEIRYINIRQDGSVAVQTYTILIENSESGRQRYFYTGTWQVSATVGNTPRWYQDNHMARLYGFRSNIWGCTTLHPHISSRTKKGCLGNSEGTLAWAMQSGQLRLWTYTVINYLKSANLEDSAGNYMGYLREVVTKDGVPVVDVAEECGYKLVDENNPNEFMQARLDAGYGAFESTTNIARIKWSIPTFDGEYAVQDAGNCTSCGKFYNLHKLTRYNVGGRETKYYCEECKSNMLTCDSCGRIVDKRDAVEFNGKTYCKNCIKDVAFKCPVCLEWYALEEGTSFNSFTDTGDISGKLICRECVDIAMRTTKDIFVHRDIVSKHLKLVDTVEKCCLCGTEDKLETLDFGIKNRELNNDTIKIMTKLPVGHTRLSICEDCLDVPKALFGSHYIRTRGLAYLYIPQLDVLKYHSVAELKELLKGEE